MTFTERDRFFILEDAVLLKECEQNFQKGSGNGGQKINKTSSAVRLLHKTTGISVFCADFRSQTRNRHEALKKLRLQIALSIRAEMQDPDFSFLPEPSENNDRTFLPWTARLLDVLQEHVWDLHLSAESLHVSVSKLDRILRSHPVLQRYVTEQKNRA